MARRRIPLGQHGEISYDFPASQATSKYKVRARTRVRDHDGGFRTVTASGPSKEAARHTLLEDLRLRFQDDVGLGADGITPTTKINALVAEWLREAELRRPSTEHDVGSTGRPRVSISTPTWASGSSAKRPPAASTE